MCFLRDRPASEAMEMLELALPHRDVIAGVGIDSAEAGHPPGEFAEAYARAREAGFVAVAHAGEEGPPAYISEALDVLEVRRIDHGVAAIRDPALQRRLAASRIPLTMCPLSNLELQVTPDLALHPLKRLLDAGIVVTVNSDDPAYFGGYLLENYVAAQKALGLTRADLAQLARNSITASLLAPERKAELVAEIDRVAAGG
jgi:adenosine deaminase